MELTRLLKDKTVYFDTNIFIYLLEGNKSYSGVLTEIQHLLDGGHIQVISSDLVYTELLPRLAKHGNKNAMEQTVKLLLACIPRTLDTGILIHAGILCGETGMKTPDAIHVATAMASKCGVFLTNE